MRISDWSSDVCSSDLRFSLEDAKPDLNLVEPAGAGGREVKGDVRMRGEPVLVFLVGAQVVQDDVDLPVSGLVGNDLVHEGLKVGPLLGLGDRKSTRLNSSHSCAARLPSSACKNKNNSTTSEHARTP